MPVSDAELLAAFPDALIDQDSRAYFAGLMERKLLLNRCQDCGYWIYPARPVCPECWSTDVVPTEPSGEGTVYTLTTVHQGQPVPGQALPAVLAVVELPEREGLRYLTTIVGCEPQEIHIGMEVQLTWVDGEASGVPRVAFQPRLASSDGATPTQSQDNGPTGGSSE